MTTPRERFEARKQKKALSPRERFEARKTIKPESSFLTPPSGPTELRQDRPIRQSISKVARPILEFGGAMIGGIAGLGAGAVIPTVGEEPALFTVGEAVGFAGGKSLADTFDALLGLPTSRTTRTAKQAFEDVPKDIAEGQAISMGGQIVGKGLELGFKQFFGPSKKFTPEKQEIVRIAKENDINLTPSEITETAPLSLFESLLDKLIASSGQLQKNHLETLEGLVSMSEKLKSKEAPAEVIELLGSRIIDATNRALKSRDDIATGALVKVRDRTLALLGTNRERFIVGEEVQAALKPRSVKAQERVTDKFNRFWELVRPDEEIADDAAQVVARKILEENEEVPIRNANLLRLAKKIAKEPIESLDELAAELGLSRDMMKQIDPEDLKALLEENGLIEKIPSAKAFDLRRKELNQIMKEEDLAIKSGVPGFKGQSSLDGGRAKLLKEALDKDLEAFATPRGGEVLERFHEANAAAGRFKALYGSPEMKRIVNADPGKVLDTIVQTDRVKEWRAFKKSADKESVEKIRQSLVAKLIGPDDVIDPKFLASQMKRYQPGILREVLGQGTVSSLKKVASRTNVINDLNIQDPLFKAIARRDPGQVFGTIIKRGSPRTMSSLDAGNIGRLNKLQKAGILDEVGIERIKARYLEEVFTFNKQARLSPQSIVTNVQQFGERTKNFLLNAEEVSDLDVITKIAKAARGSERIAGNPSGTAQNIISFTSIGMIIRHPLKNGFGFVLVPQAIAKLYLSPAGRKLLVEGFTTPRGTIRAAELFTKLAGIAGADAAIDPRQDRISRPDISEMIDPIPPSFNPEPTISQAR